MSGSPMMQTWVQLLLAASWQVVVLALLVWLGERMHWLRSPRVRHLLWWFVLLAPLALAPARLLLSQRHAVMRLPAPAAVTRITDIVAPASLTVTPVAPPPFDAAPAPEPPRPFPWTTAVAAVWLLGCAAMALRLVVGHWRVRRMLLESTPVDAGAPRALLDELCARSGVHAALRQSERIGAAMLCGVRRPVVIVPREWLGELAPSELRALLAHEVAHLRRRDLLTMLAQRLVEIPLFFHPVVWAAGRCLAAVREELCDAWAVAQGADPTEYARCLTRVAVRAQTRFAIASVGLVEGKSRLRQRVEAILGSRSRGTVSRRVAIAIAAVLLVSIVGFAAVTVATPKQTGAPETIPAARTPDGEPLSAQQQAAVEAARAPFGAEPGVYRLQYDAPFPHRLTIEIERWERRRHAETLRFPVSEAIGAGPHTLMLLAHPELPDQDYSCVVTGGPSALPLGSVTVRDIERLTSGGGSSAVLPLTSLAVGTRTLFWTFGGISGPPSSTFGPLVQTPGDLPRLIAESEIALAAYVTIAGAAEQPASEPSAPNQAAIVDFTVLGADGKPPMVAAITLDDGRDVYAQIERLPRGVITQDKGSLPAGAGNMVIVGGTGKVTVSFPNPEPETRALIFALRSGSAQAARVTLPLEPGSHRSQSVTLEPLPPEVGRPGQAVLDFRVFLPDGKPAAGAAIILEQREQSARHPVYTDASGRATVAVESPTYKSEFRVTHPDPAHPGKLLETEFSMFLDPGMHVSKIVALPASETPLLRELRGKIEELPWDGSARSIQQARELVAQADRKAGGADTTMWMSLGLRLYAGGRYPEALQAMKTMAERAGADPMELFSSWVWQGHLLDLMGRRAEALAAYRKALQYVGGATLVHSQWGMTIDRAWVEQRLQTPFRRPGASASEKPKPEKDRATLDLTVVFRNGEPVPDAGITLQVQTKALQVFEKADQPGQLVGASRPGSRRLWELYWALGKTDRHGKATVTITHPGPGTRSLIVTYHDPRLQQDFGAKRLLALQPGTRTSATITIPSGAAQTIRSAPSATRRAATPAGETAAPPTAEGNRALLDLTVVRADGKPAAGAALTVEGRMPWEGPVWRGKTDAEGKATVVIEHPQPNTRSRLLISYAGPGVRGMGLPAPVALELSPGTRTSATIALPVRAGTKVRSAPRDAEEAAARAKRDAAAAAIEARLKAKQAEEKAYWQRRRAEIAAMSPSARRAEARKVEARLRQVKAKARPLEARTAELDKLEQAIVNRLRAIEAESPGADTPEGRALKEKFNAILAEQSRIQQQQDQLLDQRTEAERELALLQRAGEA